MVVLVVRLAVVVVGLRAAAVVAVAHPEGEAVEEDVEALVVLMAGLELLLSPIVMLVFLSPVRRRTCWSQRIFPPESRSTERSVFQSIHLPPKPTVPPQD